MELLIGFLFGVVLHKMLCFGSVFVAEEPPSNSKSSTIEVVQSTPDPDHDDALQSAELKTFLEQGLSVTEKLILTLYYYEELTMKDIGRMLDLSESRVSQLHSSILARLKSHLQPRQTQSRQAKNSYPHGFLFSLSERELQFVGLYYFRGLSIQDTARVMRLSESEAIDLYCAISRRLDERFPFEGD